jgi:hypothetical protein
MSNYYALAAFVMLLLECWYVALGGQEGSAQRMLLCAILFMLAAIHSRMKQSPPSSPPSGAPEA